jgi:ABC-type multidrug transport system ATPase subunit
MASYQYVYHMDGVSKTYPGGKKCFENIRLSFLPGVKIGVVGVNGAGKSTLLRIMAGWDKDFTGEAWAAEGAHVGYLPQEPAARRKPHVRDNVMLGVKAKKDKLDRFNELAMNYSDETADEMAQLQDEIDSENLWDLDSQIDVAMEALRCPPDDADARKPLGRGTPPRGALQAAAGSARHAASGRADQPPRRRNHRLAAAAPDRLQGHLPDRHPRPLFPRRHHRLDPRTGPRPRHPLRGQLFRWLEQKAKRLEQEAREDKSKQKTLQRELEWIRAGRQGAAGQAEGPDQRYEELASQSERERVGKAQIVIPNGPRLGQKVIEIENLKKGYGDKLLIEDLTFSLPPGGIVGVIGPNGAGKSTLFRMLTGQEEPDGGTLEYGDTVKLSYVDQSRDALDADKTVWEEISGGAEIIELGDASDELPRLLRGVQLQGRRPAEEGGPAVGRRTQPRPHGEAAEVGRQRAAARRADERPRRGDAARAGRRAGGFRGLRRHHLPRPVLPRPALHPHPRLRGRGACGVVRGQLRGLRGRQEAAAGTGRAGAEAGEVQEVREVFNATKGFGFIAPEAAARTCSSTSRLSSAPASPASPTTRRSPTTSKPAATAAKAP